MKHSQHRTFLAIALISAIILGAIPIFVSAQPISRPASALDSWSLIWSDEFNGSGALSSSNWLYATGHSYPGGPANWGTGEIESFTTSTDNVYQSGGYLYIKAIRDGSGNWTSGRVETQRTDFQPPVSNGGLAVEARLQLPNVTGSAAQGYWPAFWMLGEAYRGNYWNWPSIGEIDIMENINGANAWWGTLHCGTSPGGPCNETAGLGSGRVDGGWSPTLQAGMHTYRMEYDRSVSPEQIRWYVDGVLRHTVNATAVDATTWNNALHHGFFIIFNLAIGGEWAGAPTSETQSGAAMVIDYVRVYTASGGPTPVPTNTPTPLPSGPYLGSPVSLPGVIEAENFDTGGEGAGFHDTTTNNQGGYSYRTDSGSGAVDIASNCGDGSSSTCVNWIAPGEWLKYSVNIPTAGTYTMNFRQAGPGGGVFHVETSNGTNVTGNMTQPNTGGWNTYQTTSVQVNLPAGSNKLRLVFDSCPNNCNLNNLNWISVSGGTSPTPTPAPQPTATPAPSNGTGTGLTGQYYDNMDFTTLKLTRTDATINFDWGSGSPNSAIGADTFSVRWTGQVQPRYSQTYTFYTNSDDGVRLWVNGQQIINNWTDHAPTENSGAIALTAGQKYNITLEYYENGGGAAIRLYWSSPSQAKEIIPQSQLYPSGGTSPTPTPSSGGEWIFCANESSFCPFSGTREVRYGANGVYVYKTLTDGTDCANYVFGDPVPGVLKSCWYR